MKINDPKTIVATLAGGYASSVTRDWALRRGLEWWAAVLLSMAAGTIVSAAVLRITNARFSRSGLELPARTISTLETGLGSTVR